jgi:hypothetical protein
MNERILKLAEEAGDYVNEVYTPPVRSKTPGKIWEDGHIGWNEQFQEKFAQLILKECIKQARKDENGLAYEAVGRIAEHFGVEE